MRRPHHQQAPKSCLNESPSEKEGKSFREALHQGHAVRLNESPSEKEGKLGGEAVFRPHRLRLNESPSEKEGKFLW